MNKEIQIQGLGIPTYVRLVMSVRDMMNEILPYMIK